LIPRLAAVLPVIVGILSLASAAHAWPLATTLAAVALALVLVGPRWELDRGRQIVTSAMGAGAGYAAAAALHEAELGSLSEAWTRFAATAFLAAAARFVIRDPKGGRVTTTALAFAGLVATGQTRGESYVVFVVLFLLTSLWALGARDHDASHARRSPRRVAVGTAVVLLAGAIGISTTLGIRRVHDWIANRVRSTAFIWHPRVGFSDKVDLGALDGLLDSDRVVLRLRGPRVDYLRGAALDLYEAGQWVRSNPMALETSATLDGAPSFDTVEIAALSERTDRFFLPLGARQIRTTPADVLVDPTGSIKRARKDGRLVARFLRGERDRASPDPPGPSDLQLPRRARVALEGLASDWVGSKTDTQEILDAIEHHLLTEYRYARNFKRSPGMDPTLDFLLRNKRGHCEYFATALALVARAAKVPARLITGYRVGEHSPFGYHVVRDRNAHAWVEAWVPGQGWTTHDATPTGELPQNLQHDAGYAASAVDALSVGYDDLTSWLGRLTVRQSAVAWVAGFAVLIWIVARGARRRERARRLPDDEAALPFLAPLISRLAREGHTRREDEPLERLAARIPDRGAAKLLERYAALRYGNVGSEQALAHDVATYGRMQSDRSP
jgi:Transglutaminase-like superfamily/TgpA N-terminal domain